MPGPEGQGDGESSSLPVSQAGLLAARLELGLEEELQEISHWVSPGLCQVTAC